MLARNKQDAALLLRERVGRAGGGRRLRRRSQKPGATRGKIRGVLASRNRHLHLPKRGCCSKMRRPGCACRARAARRAHCGGQGHDKARHRSAAAPAAAAAGGDARHDPAMAAASRATCATGYTHATELWDVRHLRGWPQVPRYVKEPIASPLSTEFAAMVARVQTVQVRCRPGRHIVPYSEIVAPRFSWAPPSPTSNAASWWRRGER